MIGVVRMEKVSVTLPAELVDEAKSLAGEGGFSRFVAYSLAQRLRSMKLLEAVKEFEARYGNLDDQTVGEARGWLP